MREILKLYSYYSGPPKILTGCNVSILQHRLKSPKKLPLRLSEAALLASKAKITPRTLFKSFFSKKSRLQTI